MNCHIDPFSPLTFQRGAPMRNRLALAPLNLQGDDDGCVSDDGFGMVMTCAAAVHPQGKGCSRQLGVHAAAHRAGRERLADDMATWHGFAAEQQEQA